jgi:apocytochrome f
LFIALLNLEDSIFVNLQEACLKASRVINAFKLFFLALATLGTCLFSKVSYTYPIFAQQSYQSPREVTGAILCSNCHLTQKPVEVEVAQAVLSDTVFEAEVSILSDTSNKQLTAEGTRGYPSVGAVLILPEGFKLAPKDRISADTREKTRGEFVQPYSKDKANILVVGPISRANNREVVFPVLSPDLATNKGANFLNYPIYVGGNCGRGQIYPTGEKSNNAVLTSTAAGKVTAIQPQEKGGIGVVITTADNDLEYCVPPSLELAVKVKDVVGNDYPLVFDGNVGGFGQGEAEIVLQNPSRVKGMVVFLFVVTVTQILLVVKKKQFEKVQAVEGSV